MVTGDWEGFKPKGPEKSSKCVLETTNFIQIDGKKGPELWNLDPPWKKLLISTIYYWTPFEKLALVLQSLFEHK